MKKNKFTKEQLKKLHDGSDAIQPDIVRERNLEGATKNDGVFYDEMELIYKSLCEKDITFALFFLLPDSKKAVNFFRICEAENKTEFQMRTHNIMMNIYKFLCWAGIIKALEKLDYFKILPKGEHKTWEEINNFR